MPITTKIYNEQTGFPFVVEAEVFSIESGRDSRLGTLKESKEVSRNFGVNSFSQFDEFLQFFKQSSLRDYARRNFRRTKLSEGNHTPKDYHVEQFSSLHNELSYSAQWPVDLLPTPVLEKS